MTIKFLKKKMTFCWMSLRCCTTAWLQEKYTICCVGAPNANNQEKTEQQLTEQRIWVSLGIFFFPSLLFFFFQTINYLRGIYINTESHAVSSHMQHRVEKRGWFYYARPRGTLTLGIRYQMYSAVMGTAKSCKRFAASKCSNSWKMVNI